MAPSYRDINYSLRPAKAVERKMLCDTFRRLHPFGKIESYRYIGFGSLYFTDFHLFHSALGLVDMLSIEKNGNARDSFEFNKPFECVKMDYRLASQVLPDLRWDSKSIIWLDYDGKLDTEILSDIQTVCAKATTGSLLIVSVNIQPDLDIAESERQAYSELTKQPYTLDNYRLSQFRKQLGETIPQELTGKDLRGTKINGRFTKSDFTNLAALIAKLRAPQKDNVSAFLTGKLSGDTLDVIQNESASPSDLEALVGMLTADFNAIIEGPLIYEFNTFSSVTLRSETKQFLTLNPSGLNLLRLNRLLLEDAYNVEISRKRQGLAGVNRRFITNTIQDALSARNATRPIGNKIEYKQIFNFLYNDGAAMLTVGGVLYESSQQKIFDLCSFDELQFIRQGVDPFEIQVPCLTLKEIAKLNAQLPRLNIKDVKVPGLTEDDVNNYQGIYRYFPTFAEAIFA